MEVMHCLYWHLHRAYLVNDRTEARRFASFLDAEERSSDATVLTAIGAKHYSRYLRMRDAMERGRFDRLRGDGDSIPGEVTPRKEKTQAEKEFCRELIQRHEEMLELTGASPGSIINPESDLNPYGRCDFTIYDYKARVAIALEIKMGTAPTTVVSQVDKYILALELDMNKTRWDEVRGFVMAEAFDEYVSSELPRVGVNMILNSSGSLSLLGKV